MQALMLIVLMFHDLDEYLLTAQLITEGSDNFSGEKVEHNPKEDADGEGWQSFPEQRQTHQGQTQTNQNCHKTGQSGVPVTVTAGFTNQNTVEYEVSQTQFHSSIFLIFLIKKSIKILELNLK